MEKQNMAMSLLLLKWFQFDSIKIHLNSKKSSALLLWHRLIILIMTTGLDIFEQDSLFMKNVEDFQGLGIATQTNSKK